LNSRCALVPREVSSTASNVNSARRPLVSKPAVCKGTLMVTLLAALLVSAPSPAGAQLKNEMVGAGILSPIAVVPDPMIPGVIYVVEQQGIVRVLRNGFIALSVPFIDLRGTVASGGERGLLGMAFSPDLASGRVYFNFTNAFGHTVIARFKRSARNQLTLDP
jgi:glucose/arabinose dehydrogenase